MLQSLTGRQGRGARRCRARSPRVSGHQVAQGLVPGRRGSGRGVKERAQGAVRFFAGGFVVEELQEGGRCERGEVDVQWRWGCGSEEGRGLNGGVEEGGGRGARRGAEGEELHVPVGEVHEGGCSRGEGGGKGFPEALKFAGEKGGEERGGRGWEGEEGGGRGEDRGDVAEDRGEAWFG